MVIDKLLAEQKAREEAWNDSLLAELKWRRTGWKESYLRRIPASVFNITVRNARLVCYAHDQAEERIRVMEKKVRSNPANLKYRFKLAEAHLLTGDYKRALGQAAKALEVRAKLKDPVTDRIAGKIEELAGPEDAEEKKTDLPVDAAIANIICHVFNGEFSEALDEARGLAYREKDLPELDFLIGDLTEKQGNTIPAQWWYRTALQKMLSKSVLPLEFFTESRNRVFRMRWDYFPSGTLYAKEYLDRQTLQNEWNNTVLFRECLGSCIQLPITEIYSEEDMLFFRSAGETTLQEHIRNRTRKETL